MSKLLMCGEGYSDLAWGTMKEMLTLKIINLPSR